MSDGLETKDIANGTLLHQSWIEAALRDAVQDCKFCATWHGDGHMAMSDVGHSHWAILNPNVNQQEHEAT